MTIKIEYPDLPVTAVRHDIAKLISENQVVIIAGETGSGKTTQLPKICLELGRGQQGMIGHTQPRRIAARAVADRIAEELQAPELVAWTIRFTDRVTPQTQIRVMTDGILLAEIQRDRLLKKYDTIIIDEAHERSLNIDFLLGYLKRILPQRPDLKIIITSATIDPDKFAKHFDGAPIIEVSGRSYPVEIHYAPLAVMQGDREVLHDQIDGIYFAITELMTDGPGDILVFLAGEREIRETAEALTGKNLRHTEVVPLYGRLSAAEQQRIFQPHTGRRIVLATNVAETSLTVPGIRYVIDPGTARISRYSRRLKVQRLPVEPISQAAAQQRAGRCGRVADGICIRLYSQDDFEARPRFTEPEINRTNLASVILNMMSIGLGDISAFPFIDPPDGRSIRDGLGLLHELGAVGSAESEKDKKLTSLGRKLARLPIDPRLSRMILQADREGCVPAALVVTSALAISDPRERPLEASAQADQCHARFRDPTSDFGSWLNLWNYLAEQQSSLSGSAFRKMCKAEYLHYLRIREWQDVYQQLLRAAQSMGLSGLEKTQARARIEVPQSVNGQAALHRSLLSGLLSHIGLRDLRTRDYLGARGARFTIWPGSAVAAKPPDLIMAAELVETSRLWGRTVAKIDPAWVEELAGPLVKRSYSEPHWSSKRAAVMARERVLLYGVPLIADRLVGYGAIDPVMARDLFIRRALVEGDWRTHHTFFAKNVALLDDVEELQQRTRRRDLIVDDDVLFDFYDDRIPQEVVSGRHFDSWWKSARQKNPEALTFSADLLRREQAPEIVVDDFPTCWRIGELNFTISYHFEPGTTTDGATVHIPLPVLRDLSPDPFTWHVPGLRLELVTALLRSLPKSLRRSLIPAPDRAATILQMISPESGPLLPVLAAGIRESTGTVISPEDWDWSGLPAHLRITFLIEDESGRELGRGKDLKDLQDRLQPELRSRLAKSAGLMSRTGLTSWNIGVLAKEQTAEISGHAVTAFPALVDEGKAVGVQLFTDRPSADRAHAAGVRRLLRLLLPNPVPKVLAKLSNDEKLALSRVDYTSATELMDDAVAAAVDVLLGRLHEIPRDEESFTAAHQLAAQHLVTEVLAIIRCLGPIFTTAYQARSVLSRAPSAQFDVALQDISQQLTGLIYPGFITRATAAKLPDIQRYLTAINIRLDRLLADPRREELARGKLETALSLYHQVQSLRRTDDLAVEHISWMIQEFRISLFAPTMKTAYSISVQRINKAVRELTAGS